MGGALSYPRHREPRKRRGDPAKQRSEMKGWIASLAMLTRNDVVGLCQ